MADDQQFAFAAGESDVHQFAGRLVLIVAAEHRPGQIAGDGGVENHDVALLPLEVMDGADAHVVHESFAVDEILKQSHLVAIGSDEADARRSAGRAIKGLSREGHGNHRVMPVARGAVVIFLYPRMRVGRVDKGQGLSWERGLFHEQLPRGADPRVRAIGQAGLLVEPRREGCNIGMHAVLRGERRDARILVVLDAGQAVDVAGEPVFRQGRAGFADRRELEEVADDEDLPLGEAERGKERGRGGHRALIDDHDIEAFPFQNGRGIGARDGGGEHLSRVENVGFDRGDRALTGGDLVLQRHRLRLMLRERGSTGAQGAAVQLMSQRLLEKPSRRQEVRR